MIIRYNLSPTATLRTAVEEIADPVEFVRQVLQNMTGMHGDSIVRVGLKGPAERPSYRIEMLIYDKDGTDVIHEQPIVNIHGRTHKELNLTDPDHEHWSTVSMSFKEVQILLGELRAKAKQR